MRILVTGGAGLLGAAFAGRMLRNGQAVMAADAFAVEGDGRAARGARATALKQRGAEIRRLDIGDAAAVRTLLAEFRPEVVVNAARLPADTSVRPLLVAAKELGVELLLHVSESDLYGPPPEPGVRAREDEPLAPQGDPRLVARQRDEEAVFLSGIPSVVFRCFELVAADLPPGRLARDVADAVRSGAEVPLPDHDGRDFLDVEDAARALHLAFTRRPEGRTLNLGSGTAVSLRALAEEIGRYAGREVRFGPSPPPLRVARVADTTAIWETLRFGPEVGLPAIAAALARPAPSPERAAPAADPAPPTTPAAPTTISRRDMFGIFRRPLAPRK